MGASAETSLLRKDYTKGLECFEEQNLIRCRSGMLYRRRMWTSRDRALRIRSMFTHVVFRTLQQSMRSSPRLGTSVTAWRNAGFRQPHEP